MSSSAASGMDSTPSVSSQLKVRNSADPGWKYGELVTVNDLNTVKCKFCGHASKGGVYRLKEHLAKKRGNVAPCNKVPKHVMLEIIEHMDAVKKKKQDKSKEQRELREVVNIECGNNQSRTGEEEMTLIGSKRPHTTGPMDRYTSIDPDVAIKERKLKQTSIKDPYLKEKRERVNQFVAQWAYEAGISFHAFTLNSFALACEAIGQYGSGYKPPSQYELSELSELSELLLKKQVEKTKEQLQSHIDAWKKTGCSIMIDAWSDRKNMSIMNLCVNCELGTSFLRSMNASADAYTAQYIFKLVDSCIEEVGVENVIQVVADNAAANLAAARILHDKRPQIYWSSCAANCLDLMLEDIGKLYFKGVIDKAKSLTIFIYSHHKTLNMMRMCTKGEIVRPGITRFATSFLTMQSINEKKDKLKLMFTSEEWQKSKWYKTASGRKAAAIVLSAHFWGQVTLALKVFTPLVRVLRIVDGDTKPSMGFVYGGLLDAIKEIKEVCKDAKYKPIVDIIEERIKGKLDTPLHSTAYYLNPFYFYRDADEIDLNEKVMDGLLSCIENFYPDSDIQYKILTIELEAYTSQHGLFGRTMAVRHRSIATLEEFNPVQWWYMYGATAPHLKAMAMKILNLTCSSSGCERNWSTFEMVHTKEKNWIDVKRLNDLVYVQFNAKLLNRKLEKKKDPLLSKDKSHAAEWLSDQPEDDEVIGGMGLDWNTLADLTGVEDVFRPRMSSRVGTDDAGPSADVGADKDVEIVETDDENEEEEGIDSDFGFESDDESESHE